MYVRGKQFCSKVLNISPTGSVLSEEHRQNKNQSRDSRMKYFKHTEKKRQKNIPSLKALFQIKTFISGTLIWQINQSRYSLSLHSTALKRAAEHFCVTQEAQQRLLQNKINRVFIYTQQHHVNRRFSL